jgi:hypothetical protein
MNTHDIKLKAKTIGEAAAVRVGENKTHPAVQDAASILLLCDCVAALADRVANLETALADRAGFMDK